MKRCASMVLSAFLSIMGCVGDFYRIQDRTVTFDLNLPDAREVYFAYSLEEFKLHEVSKKGPTGRWQISVAANLEFGYFFMVDGVVYLPDCPYREVDDFGSENCIFIPDQ